jgi:hypothetical protein
MRTNYHKRTMLFALAMTMSAAVLLAPTEANAQKCTPRRDGGCAKSNVCSPVDRGVEPGQCKTEGSSADHLECNCVGGKPTPPPDPCSDRTAMGKIVCNIWEPIVTQHESEYPNIVFAPGDIVQVSADGCVQSGGFGATWKRYVNPTGNNADRLYHGLIRLPTGTKDSALVRIYTVIGRNLRVTGIGVPESQLFLHLGYEDDNYSDNGYYSHDDGDADQCKTADSNDGGPAHVKVTIFRGPGVTPDPQSSRFDFDVLSNSVDPNGLPLNPQWSSQLFPENQGKIPDTSWCHDFSMRWWGNPLVLAPNFPDCTDQTDGTNVDLPQDLNAEVCNVGGIGHSSFPGHVNWFPVTVEGHAGWGDHQVPDDDYTFTFTFDEDPPGCDKTKNLMVNGRCGLHVEFDSDETIDNFTDPDPRNEWKKLHDTVDNGSKEDVQMLFDGHTILTGMFGLDGEHNMKAELHPLYAMATRRDKVQNDPSDEVWLMFVRNQGDEGMCSSQVWDAGFEDYTVRLPWREGSTSVDVNWEKTKFWGNDGTSGPTVAVLPPPVRFGTPGVFVSFHLGPAVHSSSIFDSGASNPLIYGALHLIWKGQPALVSPASSTPSADEADDIEHQIAEAIDQLPLSQRQQVKKARVITGARTAMMYQLRPTDPVRVMTEPPALPRIGELQAIKAGPAIQKVGRDAALMRALCAATNARPAGVSADVCHTLPPENR